MDRYDCSEIEISSAEATDAHVAENYLRGLFDVFIDCGHCFFGEVNRVNTVQPGRVAKWEDEITATVTTLLSLTAYANAREEKEEATGYTPIDCYGLACNGSKDSYMFMPYLMAGHFELKLSAHKIFIGTPVTGGLEFPLCTVERGWVKKLSSAYMKNKEMWENSFKLKLGVGKENEKTNA